ncbi:MULTISPECIES: hypothetical protein [Burkholderia]|jgi:hypothetical protein|uniref:Uncharacterized protein n=2 Tax=Burkholderia cepacia complex TaxID=87882 RepID=A0AAP1VFF4_9BURK|nr:MULTISPECIES: hypothetical protein [Burkholderia]EKS9800824.1 hypothetical protein [Burkholderia cepacia]EKS9808491.1 hypothetical protein [Burkholderia cepacia]EKS9816160.1 hypothetical protein [Burkholderia cepacia]EKS9823800.1 hypothetical protein [Burkholderia cepacia]EKS9831447.1 hypothetical protein [Burkholderia cepacia]
MSKMYPRVPLDGTIDSDHKMKDDGFRVGAKAVGKLIVCCPLLPRHRVLFIVSSPVSTSGINGHWTVAIGEEHRVVLSGSGTH